LVALVVLLSQLPAFAATYTVTVGDNFYSPQNLTVRSGDVVTFQWQAGSHPTQLNSSPGATSPAWTVFQMNSSSQTRTMTFTTVGVYNYYCTAHGAPPNIGMYGNITVAAATPTQDARPAAATLNLYPNPVRGGQVTISLGDTKGGSDYVLRVNNIIGSEVRKVVLRPETATSGQPVDLSNLPSGIYFCSLMSNDKVIATKRITVQN
jgi:plastocyanin